MDQTMIAALRASFEDIPMLTRVGRVERIAAGAARLRGLSDCARLGDRAELRCASGPRVSGEIVALEADHVVWLAEGAIEGARIGDRARLLGRAKIAPGPAWRGRIVDPFGAPLDGRPLPRGLGPRDLRAPPPPAAGRKRLGARADTGSCVFDTFLPIARGQRIGLFAGSGVGKSSLLARLARGVAADVVVVALIGERGRELREFAETTLGPEGMAKSVIVAATSDQPALTRRRCAWTAMTVAEYFRDQGLHVLFLADSVTRFAEAHREIALAAGESPSLRGFPPSVAPQIMALAERAGPGPEGQGDITAVFSVLVAGSDMEEPIADILRGTLDGHVVLDRTIAERGRYPAIDLLRSVSRSLPGAASAEENALLGRARRLLGAYDRAEMMIQAGLYTAGSDPLVDAAIRVWPDLDAFIAAEEPGGVAASFQRLAAIVEGARAN